MNRHVARKMALELALAFTQAQIDQGLMFEVDGNEPTDQEHEKVSREFRKIIDQLQDKYEKAK